MNLSRIFDANWGEVPLEVNHLLVLLVSIGIGASLLALWPRRTPASTLNDRMKAVVAVERQFQAPAPQTNERRRRAVEDTLREMAAKE